MCLVGNKADLETSKGREVAWETGKKYADKNNMLYYETSTLWQNVAPMIENSS